MYNSTEPLILILKGFVRYHVEPGTTVYTDEALGY